MFRDLQEKRKLSNFKSWMHILRENPFLRTFLYFENTSFRKNHRQDPSLIKAKHWPPTLALLVVGKTLMYTFFLGSEMILYNQARLSSWLAHLLNWPNNEMVMKISNLSLCSKIIVHHIGLPRIPHFQLRTNTAIIELILNICAFICNYCALKK